MATMDIYPFQGSGIHAPRKEMFPCAAAGNFVVGEPVRVNTAGNLIESVALGAGPTVVTDATLICGIAAGNGDVDGSRETFRNNQVYPGGNALGQGIATDGFPNTNDFIPVWVTGDPQTRWITRNFTTNATAFGNAAPATTNIGDAAQLIMIGSAFGVSIAAAANADLGRVVDVLDSLGRSIAGTTNAGVFVVFSIILSQFSSGVTTLGRVDAPAA